MVDENGGRVDGHLINVSAAIERGENGFVLSDIALNSCDFVYSGNFVTDKPKANASGTGTGSDTKVLSQGKIDYKSDPDHIILSSTADTNAVISIRNGQYVAIGNDNSF